MIDNLWIEENARRTTQADWDFYNEATRGLYRSGTDDRDEAGNPIPYGSGPHCVQIFRAVKKLVDAQRIFEIGFNRGHGSAIWLALGCRVISTDIAESKPSKQGMEWLTKAYTLEFCYINRMVFGEKYFRKFLECDLAFIDGDHSEQGVLKDIALIKPYTSWLLFDDWLPKHGPGVQPAIEKSGLKLVALFGTMALCYNSNEYTHRSE